MVSSLKLLVVMIFGLGRNRKAVPLRLQGRLDAG
jgi:hypothetical protein